MTSTIRFSTFPRTEPPPDFVIQMVEVFKAHEAEIATEEPHLNGLKSDEVLAQLRPDLEQIGFEVESGKKKEDKIERPVFFGENGVPAVRYEVDAYHADWRCGLEVEAGRGWMGNAVYRDLILASVMVGVDYFVLAVATGYRYKTGGRIATSHDYDNATNLVETIFSHESAGASVSVGCDRVLSLLSPLILKGLMMKKLIFLSLLASLTTSIDLSAQEWRFFTEEDEMTGETQAYAVSSRTTSVDPMPFPYTGVKGWLGFGCDGLAEWAYVGFTEAPNLTDTRARSGGYSTFSTRIRWDDGGIERVSMTQNWGDRFLGFNNDAKIINRIAFSNTVLLELSWYGTGRTHFRFNLAGSAKAITQARQACGSHLTFNEVREIAGGTSRTYVSVGEEIRIGTCDPRSWVALYETPDGAVTQSRIGRSNVCAGFAAKANVLDTRTVDGQLWIRVEIPTQGLTGWVHSRYVNPERNE